MSTATKARPVMHRLHAHQTDGVVTYDWTHDDHYVTAADALANRARRLREMGNDYAIHGNSLHYVDSSGMTHILTYEDVPA